jgi:hypothetical protein
MALYAKVSRPVVPSETYSVLLTIDQAKAKETVSHAVTDGILRPFDIEHASIDEPALLWVPFWRLSVSVDGFHIGLSTTTTSNGRSIPIPTGGARHKDADIMICARTVFPYEAKLPSLFGKISGTPPLEVPTSELGLINQPPSPGEVLDADVDRERAQSIATGMLLRAVSPTHAIYAKYDPQIRSTIFCLYPMYFARYRYEGEARRHAGEDFFVAISGKTGAVVSAKSPSAVRAVAAKVRRLLSFDRR